MEVVASISFGAAGNSDQFFAAGFADGENGFNWSLGPLSRVEFPNPDRAGAYFLCIKGFPFAPGPNLAAQTLRVSVNGHAVGGARLSAPFEIEWAAPPLALRDGRPIVVEFAHPDAARPCDVCESRDNRRIAVAYNRIDLVWRGEAVRADAASAEPSDPVLAVMFESLGGDCEFGFIQRALGSEPLGLLRFAGMAAKDLGALLRARLDGLGSDETLSVREHEGELFAWDSCYQFGAHIWGTHDLQDPEALRASEVLRIQLLAKKLLRDLAEATKIFVFRPRDEVDEAEMDSVYEALQAYGDHHLLWVNRCNEARPETGLEVVRANLWRGYVAAPTGGLEETTNLADWVKLCRMAWRRRQTARGEREDDGGHSE
jgi:hypothetical protein